MPFWMGGGWWAAGGGPITHHPSRFRREKGIEREFVFKETRAGLEQHAGGQSVRADASGLPAQLALIENSRLRL
jgi:hypothetical protein